LYDDGTHGDAAAADGVFTTSLTLSAPVGQALLFLVSAEFDDLATGVSSPMLLVPVVGNQPVTSTIAQLAASLRAGDLTTAYQQLGESLNTLHLLDAFAPDALAEVAAALETCTVGSVRPDAQLCTTSAPFNGRLTDFEFLIVRDAFGVWRVIQW
jgi:hypothetical protein